MFNFTRTIAKDLQTVALEFPKTLTMTASEVEELIQRLIEIRSTLQPEVTRDPELFGPKSHVEDPQYYTTKGILSGHQMLGLRHPGLGWLWFAFPPAEIQKLKDYWATTPPPASPSVMN